MCDQGHEIIFNPKGCKIRKQVSGKLVATTTRTPNNIYVLDEIESEKCHLGKEDESWIWNKRMGIYILTIWSKYTKTKQFGICQKLQSPLTLYVNTVNMENK